GVFLSLMWTLNAWTQFSRKDMIFLLLSLSLHVPLHFPVNKRFRKVLASGLHGRNWITKGRGKKASYCDVMGNDNGQWISYKNNKKTVLFCSWNRELSPFILLCPR